MMAVGRCRRLVETQALDGMAVCGRASGQRAAPAVRGRVGGCVGRETPGVRGDCHLTPTPPTIGERWRRTEGRGSRHLPAVWTSPWTPVWTSAWTSAAALTRPTFTGLSGRAPPAALSVLAVDRRRWPGGTPPTRALGPRPSTPPLAGGCAAAGGVAWRDRRDGLPHSKSVELPLHHVHTRRVQVRAPFGARV